MDFEHQFAIIFCLDFEYLIMTYTLLCSITTQDT